MKNDLLKRTLVFIAIGIILCCSIIPSFAIEKSLEKGTLNIIMQSNEKPMSGGLIALYYVAVSNDDGAYIYTEDFNDCKIPLNDLRDKELPKNLADYAESKNIEAFVREVNLEGKVSFSNLSDGLYLAVQIEKGKGYEIITPFLVEIPSYNLESSEHEYIVEAKPKLKPESPDIEITNPTEPSTQPRPTESQIPHTGQLNWPIPVLAFSGVLIFIIGWSLYVTKVKK